MRSVLDTLKDIEEMERCLHREADVCYAKHFFANLFEDAFKRVDSDLSGAAAVMRALEPKRKELVDLLRLITKEKWYEHH
ncbi:hypothetical protein [Duganella vulcania]|uniref:Uncharacterized protein n=1 Tax=Duganella vulcania TaxID=2692166 RepID=A0A845GGL8_9BURK|nr:hypothetical protein [Duganella vulcania]MYM92562.1 hypothetical protein [Duganella vulcania]